MGYLKCLPNGEFEIRLTEGEQARKKEWEEKKVVVRCEVSDKRIRNGFFSDSFYVTLFSSLLKPSYFEIEVTENTYHQAQKGFMCDMQFTKDRNGMLWLKR